MYTSFNQDSKELLEWNSALSLEDTRDFKVS